MKWDSPLHNTDNKKLQLTDPDIRQGIRNETENLRWSQMIPVDPAD